MRPREALVGLLLIAAATTLAYSNSFDASFHLDDRPSIVANQSVRDLLGPSVSSTRYLGYLSFALNYRVGGLDVFGYHVANLIIHICNAVLVFWLASLALRTPALRTAEMGPLLRGYLPLTAGLLFAVHPVQTQAVTYIVQRLASLATLFYLLSIASYLSARLALEVERSRRLRFACLYGLSVLAAVAAMKTKEIACTLPIVAAGCELLLFRTRTRLRLLLLAPLAAAALLVPIGLAAQHQTWTAGNLTTVTPEIPRTVYLLTQLPVIVTYLRLLVLPVRQNLDYDFPLSRSLAEPRAVFALAVLLAIAASVAYLAVRTRRTNQGVGVLVFFGMAWFFATLSVESSIIPIHDVIFEHRMYLPSAGATISMGAALLWAVERLRSRRPLALQCAAALIVTAGPLAAATYARNFVWKDDVTLWSDVVSKSPGKARPHRALGEAFLERGQVDDALRELGEAVRLDPGAWEGHYSLGNALKKAGRYEAAIAEYRRAILADPERAMPHNNLGTLFERQGRLDEAFREYFEATRLDPELAEPHYNLGRLYQQWKLLDAAIAEYNAAIRLDPGMAEPHGNLGLVYVAKGQLNHALREYREAIRLDPGLPYPHNGLGELLMKLGRNVEAVEEFRRAVELGPSPEFLFNLASALESAGRGGEAIIHYRRFLETAGDEHRSRVDEVKDRLSRLRGFPRADSR